MSLRSLLDLLAMVVLAAAYLIADHYPPWSSYYNESAAAVALGLLAVARGARWWNDRIALTAPLVLLVAAIPVVQWSFGQLHYSGDAWISALYVAGLAVALATGQLWFRDPNARPVQSMSAALLAAGLLSAIIALVQGLDIDVLDGYAFPISASAHATANIGQANNLATLLGLAAIGLLALFEMRRLPLAAALALLLPLLVGAAATQSRTALLFGPLVMGGTWWAKRQRIPLRTPFVALLLVVVVQVALAVAWPFIQQQLLIASPPSIGERSLGTGRIAAWELFLDALDHSPWIGYGWLQVGPAQLAVAARHLPISNKIWFQAHDVFLDILLWCGYPLGVGLCALLGFWFVSRWRRVRSLEGLLALLGITIVGAHALLELPHQYAYFLIPVGLWAGMVEELNGVQRATSARWMLAPIGVAMLATAEVWREYPAVEEDFRLIRFEALRIGNVHAPQPAPSAPLMSGLTAFLRTARIDPHTQLRPEVLEEIHASAERYAYAPSLFRYAQALAANGRIDEATRVFQLIGHVHGERSEARYREALADAIPAGPPGLRELGVRLGLAVSVPASSPSRAQSPPP